MPDTGAAETTPPATAPADATTEPTAPDRDGGSGEAAKWRTRLRAAEAERDLLAARLAAAQRREVERLAGEHLARGGDLWLTGAELPGLLDDAGEVDPGKVTEAASAVLAERPHWAPHGATPDADQGRKGDDRPGAPSFAEFLRGAGE